MFPGFRATAEAEGRAAVNEMDEQIAESKVHAGQFRATLEAQKRFAAGPGGRARYASHYPARLDQGSDQVV